jgi:hypothetical protein
MSMPMPSTSIRKRAPLLLVKVCVPEPMVIAVPELLHVYTLIPFIVQVQENPPLIGQGLLPKPMVVPYLNSFGVLVEESPPLIGQNFLHEPIVIAVPQLLYRPSAREPTSHWSRFAP